MRKIFIYIAISLVLPVCAFGKAPAFGVESLRLHDTYFSTCRIKWNADENSVRIQLKIFADDVYQALSLTPGFILPTTKIDSQKVVVNYVKRHLAVRQKDIPHSLELIDFQQKKFDNLAVLVVLQAKGFKPATPVVIRNALLVDAIKGQSNVVFFESGNQTLYYIFNDSKREEEILLN